MPENPCATSPCAAHIRHGIESEIGHNGNRLLLKIAGTVLVMMLIPALGGLFWLGYLHSEVTNNSRRLTLYSAKIDANEATAREVALRQSAVIQNLKDIKQRLDEIYSALESIRRRTDGNK